MYYLTYFAFETDAKYATAHTMTLDSMTELEAISDAMYYIKAKAEYMDVIEDSFKIEDNERTIVEFQYGKIVK